VATNRECAPTSAYNGTRGVCLSSALEYALSLRDRTRGLLGRACLEPGHGMLFSARGLPVMWMHTMGMRFPIDIIFLDRHDRVLRIDHDLRPWRFSSLVLGARQALELPAGTAQATQTAVGDRILFERDGASAAG
jgi:uncharacterized membrane protein (UPF0127 family)